MADLVEFFIELGCDDDKWHAYDADPEQYIDDSDLDQSDKDMLKTANNAAAINSALVARGGANRVDVADAGQVKLKVTVTLTRDPTPPQ